MKAIKTEIYLTSGQTITVYLEKMTSEPGKNSLFEKLAWDNADLALTGLYTVNVSQIVAMTTQEVEISDEVVRE